MVNDVVNPVSLAIVGIDFGQHLRAAYLRVRELQVSLTRLGYSGYQTGGSIQRDGCRLAVGIDDFGCKSGPIWIIKYHHAAIGQPKGGMVIPSGRPIRDTDRSGQPPVVCTVTIPRIPVRISDLAVGRGPHVLVSPSRAHRPAIIGAPTVVVTSHFEAVLSNCTRHH